jgi:hypothetical protein
MRCSRRRVCRLRCVPKGDYQEQSPCLRHSRSDSVLRPWEGRVTGVPICIVKGPHRRLAWEWRGYRRRTCSKWSVELVSEQVLEVDHGAGVARCRPVDYAHCQAFIRLGIRRATGLIVFSRHLQGCCANYFEDNHLANGCPVRAATITCVMTSTVTWACSLFHSSPEWVAPCMTR